VGTTGDSHLNINNDILSGHCPAQINSDDLKLGSANRHEMRLTQVSFLHRLNSYDRSHLLLIENSYTQRWLYEKHIAHAVGQQWQSLHIHHLRQTSSLFGSSNGISKVSKLVHKTKL